MDKGLVQGIVNAIEDMETTIEKLADAASELRHELDNLSSELDTIAVNLGEILEDNGISLYEFGSMTDGQVSAIKTLWEGREK